MNLHRNSQDWDAAARIAGYSSMRELLVHLYVTQRNPSSKVGDLLGISKDRVIQLLRVHDIPVRPRGGLNVY